MHENTKEWREYRAKLQREWARKNIASTLITHAKIRARKLGILFDITKSDIEVPEFCPILGIKLEVADGKIADSSPTIDRIIPELGYIKGNVMVISWRANRIKNNATVEELRKIANWLEVKNPYVTIEVLKING